MLFVNRSLVWQLFCVVTAALLVAGCASWIFVEAPTYAGTFVGSAEKVELCSWKGEPFTVTKFTIEGTIGKIKQTGRSGVHGKPECGRNVSLADSLRGWSVILVDPLYTGYPADRYAGKRLEVDGTIRSGNPYPFPGGPCLLGPPAPQPSRAHMPLSVIIVEKIVIDNTANGGQREIIRAVTGPR